MKQLLENVQKLNKEIITFDVFETKGRNFTSIKITCNNMITFQ